MMIGTKKENRSQTIRITMRRKILIYGLALSLVGVVGLTAGISRLGQTNLSSRAIDTARMWTTRTTGFSELAKQISENIVWVLDVSQEVPKECQHMSMEATIQDEIRNQVRNFLQERRVKWFYSNPTPIRNTEYKLRCSTTIPINIQIQYFHDGPKTFEREWSLLLDIELLIDADRKEVIKWKIASDTKLQDQ